MANLICAAFAWLFLPETKDRTLEEIHEIFEAGVPARKFASHVCTGAQAVVVGVAEAKNAGGVSHVEETQHESQDRREV